MFLQFMLLLTVLLILGNTTFFSWWMSRHSNTSACKSGGALWYGRIALESISDENYWEREIEI